MNAAAIAEPRWAMLLWVVAAFFALALFLERRRTGAVSAFVSAALQERLVRRPSSRRRILALVFFTLSATSLTVALMRPQWGLRLISMPRAGAEIMICLDVSRSMLAEDVAPNRLERAKADLRDLLTYLEGDQVGLIAFAGRATVLAPLTPDFGFLRLVLDQAGPHSVTRGGTRLEEPIRKAVEGFGEAGEVSRSIILVTDGEDHDSFPLEAAKEAAERGIKILAIGFGDEAGSEIVITDPDTGARRVLRDADGNVVKSRLDGEMLRQIALATDGAYVPAGTGVLDLKSIYERHIAPLTRSAGRRHTRSVKGEAFQAF
ncbi:MAG: VWA domain-containing protein, partial [Deltaproteobacteria bacterium]